ncbi:mobilization protein, partial [Lactococcus lactis]|nr:mobilization protein [Lactococcus lactis]
EQTNVETPEPYVADMFHFVDINKYDGIFDNDNKEKNVMKPKRHVEPPKQPVTYSDGDRDFYTEMLLEDQEASKNRHVAKAKQKHKEDDLEL